MPLCPLEARVPCVDYFIVILFNFWHWNSSLSLPWTNGWSDIQSHLLKQDSYSLPFLSGPVGKDGNECPISCPMKCDDSSEMYCVDGTIDANGCVMQDFCIPAKGGISKKSI